MGALERVDCTEALFWKEKKLVAVTGLSIVFIAQVQGGIKFELASGKSFFIYDWNDDLTAGEELSRIPKNVSVSLAPMNC